MVGFVSSVSVYLSYFARRMWLLICCVAPFLPGTHTGGFSSSKSRWTEILHCPAGSGNFDHSLSGNSDHLSVALADQKIVGDSVSGEGKDDRHAQAARDSGPATGGSHVDGGGGPE